MAISKIALATCSCIVVSAASAEMTFTDAVGDEATGNSNLDLTQVTVENDNASLTVKVSVADLHSDWGKHMLFFDTGQPGHIGNSNPWFRDVDHAGNSISHFIGTWLDGSGGSALSSYNAGSDSWDSVASPAVNLDWISHTIEYTIALADLGIGIGDTIRFDVASTGGNSGDPATDMMSSGYHGNWGESSSLGSDLMEYTTVPAPGALALLLTAGLLARRRRA